LFIFMADAFAAKAPRRTRRRMQVGEMNFIVAFNLWLTSLKSVKLQMIDVVVLQR
jgi:hypothetical protein